MRYLAILLALVSSTFLAPLTANGQAPSGYAGTGYNVGDIAFDFTASDQFGNQVSLYQYYGRYVVLDYCAVWCPPCNFLTPRLAQAVNNDLNGAGFPTICLDVLLEGAIPGRPSTQRNALSWALGFHLTSPVLNMGGVFNPLIYTQFLDYSTPNDPDGAAFPTAVILNPRLKILAILVGADPILGNFENIILADLAADPGSRVFELIALIDSYNLQVGIANSLEVKLENALQNLDQSNMIAACNLLDAFINEVQAQTGQHLSVDQATQLMDEASAIHLALSRWP